MGGVILLLILSIAVPVIIIVICVYFANKSSIRGPRYIRMTNPTVDTQQVIAGPQQAYSQQLPPYSATDPNICSTGTQQNTVPTVPAPYSAQQQVYPPAVYPQQPYVVPVQLTAGAQGSGQEIPSATSGTQSQGQSNPDPTDNCAPQKQDPPPYSEEDTLN